MIRADREETRKCLAKLDEDGSTYVYMYSRGCSEQGFLARSSELRDGERETEEGESGIRTDAEDDPASVSSIL